MMWVVRQVAAKAKELDFASSRGGKYPTKALFADGVEILNAVNFMDFGDHEEEDRVQLIVCEECGFVHCEPGNWASLRRFGGGLVFIPAFASMTQGTWERGEYSPPHFIGLRGSPLFLGEAWIELVAQVPGFGSLEGVPDLTMREAAMALQWSAPGRVMGEFPDPPRLRREAIVAVDEGELAECMTNLQQVLDGAFQDTRPAALRSGRMLTFHLKMRGTPEWSPLLVVGDGYGLAVGPSMALVAGPSA